MFAPHSAWLSQGTQRVSAQMGALAGQLSDDAALVLLENGAGVVPEPSPETAVQHV